MHVAETLSFQETRRQTPSALLESELQSPSILELLGFTVKVFLFLVVVFLKQAITHCIRVLFCSSHFSWLVISHSSPS